MKYDVLIIGGGIVGLATAMKIKELSGTLKVAVLEKESAVARHQTGNNSGVIHAGVYYKPGSLKAINCRSGYSQLIEFCKSNDITYDLCGKLIVASGKREIPRLDDLYNRSIQNGLDKVIKIHAEAIGEYEPYATGLAALWVPYTGIVDFTDVSNKCAELFTTRLGGEIFTDTKVIDIREHSTSVDVITVNKVFTSRLIINTSGLFADIIAKMTQSRLDVRIIPFRGEYYMLRKERSWLVKNLIYPVPDPRFPFLGVHFTRRIHGGIEAGPNAVWAFKREGYRKTDFDFHEITGALSWKGFRKVMVQYWKTGLGEYYRSFVKLAMVRALQKLVPEIKAQDLVAGSSGVRALACDREGGLVDDFLFSENRQIINVLNAPSPAATACLSIGQIISEKALKRL
ncbi:MAG: L-2-hydroxyglutarate oxidase [Bacteroidales bacterium]|nr:L-2-hydroxyglutarate oxidase [Bacteroidales bacterium]